MADDDTERKKKNEGERGRIWEDGKNQKMTKRMYEFDSFYSYSESEFMSYMLYILFYRTLPSMAYGLEGTEMQWDVEEEMNASLVCIDSATIEWDFWHCFFLLV